MSQKYVSKRNQKRKQRRRLIPVLLGLGGLALVVVAILAFTAGKNPPKASENPSGEVKGAPALQVDKQEIDLGNVKLGQVVEASFNLTNVGDQALKFNEKPYIEVIEGC